MLDDVSSAPRIGALHRQGWQSQVPGVPLEEGPSARADAPPAASGPPADADHHAEPALRAKKADVVRSTSTICEICDRDPLRGRRARTLKHTANQPESPAATGGGAQLWAGPAAYAGAGAAVAWPRAAGHAGGHRQYAPARLDGWRRS